MPRSRRIRGQMTSSMAPEWQPLLDFAPEHVDDFMWMCEVELQRGHRIHAYKHYWTRRYIHLDHQGRAFAYVADDIVRQNLWTGCIEISWTRAATKHRISRKGSAYVIRNCDLFLKEYAREPGPRLWEEPRFIFLGEDEEGIELEAIAIELEEGRLLVIHAMRLRNRYRQRYEEMKQWRR